MLGVVGCPEPKERGKCHMQPSNYTRRIRTNTLKTASTKPSPRKWPGTGHIETQLKLEPVRSALSAVATTVKL